jgi:heme-degrading monooxygenase HmoA
MDTALGFKFKRIANIREAGDGTSLFVTLWEFEVKSGSEELFEQAYGPEGEWVQLFRRDARYCGTRLLRDVSRERVYVTMDMWKSRGAYEEFRKKYVKEYAEIDRICEGCTASERHIGEA